MNQSGVSSDAHCADLSKLKEELGTTTADLKQFLSGVDVNLFRGGVNAARRREEIRSSAAYCSQPVDGGSINTTLSTADTVAAVKSFCKLELSLESSPRSLLIGGLVASSGGVCVVVVYLNVCTPILPPNMAAPTRPAIGARNSHSDKSESTACRDPVRHDTIKTLFSSYQ
jgi:hypothetical protein